MSNYTATAISSSNIAFIKYWGNRDEALRLPLNPSLSMNLAGLTTTTTVTFVRALEADRLTINSQPQSEAVTARVTRHLDLIRARARLSWRAVTASHNTFPAGAGIASSASAFAALTLAGAAAAGLQLSETERSALARRGSGSAARSVPGGFTAWQVGTSDADSYAVSIAPPEHWALVDVIAVLSAHHKNTGSTEGHALAPTSPLQTARVASVAARLQQCQAAVLARNFEALAAVAELDSNIMHAVMMTSHPPLFYWEPLTLAIMQRVRAWRAAGVPVFYTIDAGANVHCLCLAEAVAEVEQRLREELKITTLLKAGVGGPARLLSADEHGHAGSA